MTTVPLTTVPTTTVTVCTTCRSRARASGQPAADMDGLKDGARFFPLVAQACADTSGAVTCRPIECLWSCGLGCSVQIMSEGKTGYSLGLFPPTDEAAKAIAGFAAAHARSDDGTVAFEDWPEGVLGHFIVRIPPVEDADGQSGAQASPQNATGDADTS